MADCQDKARDLMPATATQPDARTMQKVEDAFVKCIGSTVDEYIGLLKPMKQRIVANLKEQSK